MLDLGLVTLAAAIGWLATWLFNRASRITTRADHAVTDRPRDLLSGATARPSKAG